jgi:hypothetical protein
MGNGKKTVLLMFLSILILAIPITISIAESIGYQTYMPLVQKFPTPTPTKTPTFTPTATSTSTPTATPTRFIPITGNIDITTIYYDGSGQFEPDEYVEIKNQDVFPIQLQNWTLRDEANHVFTFPNFVIYPNQICRVYTNEDHPEWCGFDYHSGSAIWNNTGDCGYLRDSANTLIDQYCY